MSLLPIIIVISSLGLYFIDPGPCVCHLIRVVVLCAGFWLSPFIWRHFVFLPSFTIVMSSSTPFLSKDLFQCSVCLNVFTHPVSLPCGHTFCQSCILGQWTASGSSHCPKCSAVFQETPELCENSFAREMAEQIRKQKGQRSSEYRPVTSYNVLCDMCPLEKASRAVKSCLVCVASYCEVHVTSHTSRFTKHKLVQPQRMDKRICRIHERPLELYCRYDQSAVCVLCMNTEHSTHHTIPVETEWAERKVWAHLDATWLINDYDYTTKQW